MDDFERDLISKMSKEQLLVWIEGINKILDQYKIVEQRLIAVHSCIRDSQDFGDDSDRIVEKVLEILTGVSPDG